MYIICEVYKNGKEVFCVNVIQIIYTKDILTVNRAVEIYHQGCDYNKNYMAFSEREFDDVKHFNNYF